MKLFQYVNHLSPVTGLASGSTYQIRRLYTHSNRGERAELRRVGELAPMVYDFPISELRFGRRKSGRSAGASTHVLHIAFSMQSNPHWI
jgi:hypothetical protein